MTPKQRAERFFALAEEAEKGQPPQTDPHEWTAGQAIAAALREIAGNVEIRRTLRRPARRGRG